MGAVLDKAIKFAVDAHSGMNRKGTTLPYILHPLEAAAIVGSMTSDEEIIAAAVLHDVLEDTDVDEEELQANFGKRVAELVRTESEDKRTDRPAAETWELRKTETIEALKLKSDPATKMIALGDKLANIREMHSDYTKIGDKLWERFNQKDKGKHVWYYRSIADATKVLSGFPAWQEFVRLIPEVFGDGQAL